MRSVAFRATIGATAWIALGVAAVLLYRSEQQLASLTSSLHTFDLRAREATDALVDARIAQEAYVAAGQGIGFWMAKATSATESVQNALTTMRESASAPAQAQLDQANATMAEFAAVEKRVREYLKASQPLMAGDVIFSEGTEAASNLGRQVEAAKQAEHDAVDANAAIIRKQEATIAAAAAAVAAIAVLLLAPVGRRREQADAVSEAPATAPGSVFAGARSAPAPAPRAASSSMAMVRTAASLATDFGRVRDVDELKRALGRAAEAMDASGLMVWMGSPRGADLRVMLAHGYGSDVLARIPTVPRSANNAAAAAYRSGTLQIVLSRPGASTGAIVAPIMTAEGCVGALSAEIRHGAETSEAVQALAEITAAQLAGVLAQTPAHISEPQAAAH